jgi:hypothetical protein
VQLTLDGEEVLQGRIDVLVLQNQLWVVVLESKKAANKGYVQGVEQELIRLR